MLRFVPNHLKRNKTCKYAIKNLPSLKIYAPNGYKTQEMSDKTTLGNGRMLESVPDCYKNKKCALKLLKIIRMHYNLSPIC